MERTDWDWRCLKVFTGRFGEILLGGELGLGEVVVAALGEGPAVGDGEGELRAVASWTGGGEDVGVGAEFGWASVVFFADAAI